MKFQIITRYAFTWNEVSTNILGLVVSWMPPFWMYLVKAWWATSTNFRINCPDLSNESMITILLFHGSNITNMQWSLQKWTTVLHGHGCGCRCPTRVRVSASLEFSGTRQITLGIRHGCGARLGKKLRHGCPGNTVHSACAAKAKVKQQNMAWNRFATCKG